MKPRLGVLTTHPVQYYSAWFRQLSTRLDATVYYAFRQDARGQAAAGFEVEFEWDTPLLEGYRYRWLDNVAARPGLGRFRGCDTPEIAAVCARDRLQALLILGWNYKSAWQGWRACRQYGIPALMRGDSQLPLQRAAWKRALKALPYRQLLPKLDAHLYVGKRNREYLAHYGVPPGRLYFCPHSVDNQLFRARAEQAEASGETARLRRELGIPAEAMVVLFAGKLTRRKAPGDALSACLQLQRGSADPPWLLLVGSGPEEAQLRRRAAGHPVRFAGFQNQGLMPAHYRAADLLVLPSNLPETWGLAVNEAMACGLPAVVSHWAGCGPDLIEEGETGFVYPYGDLEALARCIRRLGSLLRKDPARVRRAVRRRIGRYSLERATTGPEEALQAALEARGALQAASGGSA